MDIIYIGGVSTVEVPVGDKILISSQDGLSIVYFSTFPIIPEQFYVQNYIDKSSLELGPFSSIKKIRIESKDSVVRFDIGANPSVSVGGYSSELKDLTALEITQLQNIDLNSISNSQWGYVGGLDQALSLASSPTFASVGISNSPTSLSDAVRKDYVDMAVNGINWQDSVINTIDFTISEPVSPNIGDRYINTVTGTSSVTTKSVTINYIYEWNGSSWDEVQPLEGWAVYEDTSNKYQNFNGSSWVSFGSIVNHNNLSSLQGGTSGEYYHLTSAQNSSVATMVSNGLDSLSSEEVTQLGNIDSATISSSQWGYVGGMDQGLSTNDVVQFGPASKIYRNDSATTPSFIIEQDGTGDASLELSLPAIQWIIRADNSDGDNFVIETSAGNQFFSINVNGEVHIDANTTPLVLERDSAYVGGHVYMGFKDGGTISWLLSSSTAGRELQFKDSSNGVIFQINQAGLVQFGNHTALGAETLSGFIEIKDSGGTTRKVGVIS